METLVAQPELRIRNDAETWLAEVLDGSMRTPFEYTTDGHELYAEDGGPLGSIFKDAIEDARKLQARDPKLSFELRRRLIEAGEYHDMLAMVGGEQPNVMVAVSDFPAELIDAPEDIGGYNVQRKVTMLRVVTYAQGKLRMYSQTLDGSNRQALEAIYAEFGQTPELGELLGQRIHADIDEADQPYIIDRLTGSYDRSLANQFGGEWYAGRPEPKRDTYGFVRRQHELIDRFVARQVTGRMTDTERYNIAALLTKRFEASKMVAGYELDEAGIERFLGSVMTHSLEWELQQAGNEARAKGQTFSGCGASARALLSSEEQLQEVGYGNQSERGGDEDQYGSLTFKCKFGHTNRRPRGKLIDKCWMPGCKNSVAC